MANKFPKIGHRSANTVDLFDRMANSIEQIGTPAEVTHAFETPESTRLEAGESTSAASTQPSPEHHCKNKLSSQPCAPDAANTLGNGIVIEGKQEFVTNIRAPDSCVAETLAAAVAIVLPSDPSLFNAADNGKGTADEGAKRIASAVSAGISAEVFATPTLLGSAGTYDPEPGHQGPKDRVADHPEAFVSSKKKEIYQDPGLDGCGEKSSTQEVGEYPMDDFEILDAMIRLAKPSDRDALRKLRFLCRNSSKTLSGFAAMSESELTSALRKTPCTRNGMAAKKPNMFARKIPRVIADLAAQYPEKGFPLFIPPSEKPKIPVAAEADWPLAFSNDTRAWLALLASQVGGEETVAGRIIALSTLNQYYRDICKSLSVATARGKVVDDTFGVRLLTSSSVVKDVLETMELTHAERSVAGTASALLKFASDLLGDDLSHANHIRELKRQVRNRFPPTQKTDAELLALHDRDHDEDFKRRLRTASHQIELRSDEPGLRPLDKLARISASLAVAVKLDHPAAKTEFIRTMDLKRDFDEEDTGDLYLLVPDNRNVGAFRREKVSEEIASLRLRRIASGRAHYTDSTLLFPTRPKGATWPVKDEVPTQSQNVVVHNVLGEFEAVMGCRITFREVENLIAYFALSKNPEQALAIADGLGVKYPENFVRKMSAHINKRKK